LAIKLPQTTESSRPGTQSIHFPSNLSLPFLVRMPCRHSAMHGLAAPYCGCSRNTAIASCPGGPYRQGNGCRILHRCPLLTMEAMTVGSVAGQMARIRALGRGIQSGGATPWTPLFGNAFIHQLDGQRRKINACLSLESVCRHQGGRTTTEGIRRRVPRFEPALTMRFNSAVSPCSHTSTSGDLACMEVQEDARTRCRRQLERRVDETGRMKRW